MSDLEIQVEYGQPLPGSKYAARSRIATWRRTSDTVTIEPSGEFKRNRLWDDCNVDGNRYYFRQLPDRHVLRCRMLGGHGNISCSLDPDPELRFGPSVANFYGVQSFRYTWSESDDEGMKAIDASTKTRGAGDYISVERDCGSHSSEVRWHRTEDTLLTDKYGELKRDQPWTGAASRYYSRQLPDGTLKTMTQVAATEKMKVIRTVTRTGTVTANKRICFQFDPTSRGCASQRNCI